MAKSWLEDKDHPEIGPILKTKTSQVPLCLAARHFHLPLSGNHRHLRDESLNFPFITIVSTQPFQGMLGALGKSVLLRVPTNVGVMMIGKVH